MDSELNVADVNRKLIGDLDIPPDLEESLRRHREHLVQLVISLRSAGVDEAQIEESVSILIDSYKDELIRTMKRMVQ